MNVVTLFSVSSPTSTPSGNYSSAWRAIGNATSDLPSWVIGQQKQGAVLASTSVPVNGCTGEELAHAAFEAFLTVLDSLDSPATRVWAFLPMITARDVDELNRYMRMNLGRTRAYRQTRFTLPFMPAGTCVGHDGDLLVVHAMSMPGVVHAIENPRQVPAWQYSKKFGPSAPPFTRAVVAEHLLMASGTAAVVGEDVVHRDNVDAQWRETVGHLATLRAAAGARGSWRSVQVYVRNQSDISKVTTLAQHEFSSGLERVLHAPLCRDELLVEVEAVADV